MEAVSFFSSRVAREPEGTYFFKAARIKSADMPVGRAEFETTFTTQNANDIEEETPFATKSRGPGEMKSPICGPVANLDSVRETAVVVGDESNVACDGKLNRRQAAKQFSFEHVKPSIGGIGSLRLGFQFAEAVGTTIFHATSHKLDKLNWEMKRGKKTWSIQDGTEHEFDVAAIAS